MVSKGKKERKKKKKRAKVEVLESWKSCVTVVQVL